MSTNGMEPRAGLVLGGRYELLERIAIGGMGEVWQALDRRLGRRVAAKVLRAELVGEEQFLRRLRAEARNSAGLRHPNLASLLDHGEQGGSGYLVMELVPGQTLAQRLERDRTLPVDELLGLLVQACRGLHAVHCSGVVHRDVKPANIMITPQGRLKLTDFGISLGTDQAPMTSAGMVMGTAQYLPPEQAMGRAATAAGDLYALGIVAYESLVGHRPYTGATQVDIAFAHVRTPLPALPATVPASVRAVVERMLAKDPAHRPANALVCARELEAVAAELGVEIPTPGTGIAVLAHAETSTFAAIETAPRRADLRDAAAPPRTSDDAGALAVPDADGPHQQVGPGGLSAPGAAGEPAAMPPSYPPRHRRRDAEASPEPRAVEHPAAPADPLSELPAAPVDPPSEDPAAPMDPPSGPATVERSGRAAARPSGRRRLSAGVGGRPGRGRHEASGPTAATSWRLPSWSQMSADRVWVAALGVLLSVLVIVTVMVLGTLRGADTSSLGRDPAVSYSASTVKDD